MKLKATPQDFIVEEEPAAPAADPGSASSRRLPPPQRGEFAIFQLSKTSWDTFDLVDLLSRKWNVPREAISLGGFKDRHGATVQRISVRGLAADPPAVEDRNFRAEFIGWSDRPLTARDIRGNRFRITLRDLVPQEARRVEEASAEVARFGFPNYFDAQRFGSARHGAGFMGKQIFLGRREKALRLFFTPSKHDDRKTRSLKRCVLENWGRWERCAGMGFGEYGRVLACLAESRGAFHKALERIDRRFLVLVLNAYQSYLFNAILSRWLARTAAELGCPLTALRSPFGDLQFYAAPPEPMAALLRAASLPVPGHDTVCEDPVVSQIVSEVLQQEEITLPDLRVRQMHGISVGGIMRNAVVVPEDLRASEAEEDELYPGRLKTVLSFFLPRGSYATLLVKRLMLAPAR